MSKLDDLLAAATPRPWVFYRGPVQVQMKSADYEVGVLAVNHIAEARDLLRECYMPEESDGYRANTLGTDLADRIRALLAKLEEE